MLCDCHTVVPTAVLKAIRVIPPARRVHGFCAHGLLEIALQLHLFFLALHVALVTPWVSWVYIALGPVPLAFCDRSVTEVFVVQVALFMHGQRRASGWHSDGDSG